MKKCSLRSRKFSSNRPVKRGIYRHYKGKRYAVLGTAHHSETLQELVVYRALYRTEFGRNSLWVRPREMFLGLVKIEGRRIPRFRYVGKGLIRANRKGVKVR